MNQTIKFEKTRDSLFQIELQPVSETLHDLRSYQPEGEVSTILGKVTGAKCIVGIGKPVCVPLNDFYREGMTLPKNVRGDLTSYRFFVVRFACSFLTINNCQVEEARLDIQLHSVNDKLGEPLTFDLFPRKVIASSPTVRKEKKLTTKIGVNLKFFESSLGGEYLTEVEHENYEPEITSYGVQTPKFRWKFKKTKNNPVEGDRIVFATIGKPNGTHITADFKVTTEIQTTAFKKLILDSRNDETANARYILA